MSDSRPAVLPIGRTIRLLLRASAQRSRGRIHQQRKLLRQRTAKETNPVGSLLRVFAYVLAMMLQALFAFGLCLSFGEVARVDMINHGQLPVSDAFFKQAFGDKPNIKQAILDEAGHEERHQYGKTAENAVVLQHQLTKFGQAGFAHENELSNYAVQNLSTRPLLLATGTLMALGWFVMLVCQGEGPQLDVQQRRHPMWEWLFSHPIHPGAAFFAEMLAPMAANPFYVFAPLFYIIILAQFHPVIESIAAGLPLGLALAVAASFTGKTIEIAAMLRLSSRSRGAVLGIMSWVGYVSFFAGMILMQHTGIISFLIKCLQPIAPFLALPVLPWLMGALPGGGFSILYALLAGGLTSVAIIGACMVLSLKATNLGLQGGFSDKPAAPVVAGFLGRLPFLRDPLMRKELTWFSRDRGAVVQAILIPLTLGAYQAFNLRSLTTHVLDSWNYLCGFAIICGTYFLLILGPRSLISEGAALWLPLTWPCGLESLLKAKARLWSIIADFIVGLVMIITVLLFPAAAWKIALVMVGWLIFSHGLAEKAVTLVPPMSSSGQPEKASAGSSTAAMLGTFSFAAGVFTQNWHLAAMGVVFSSLTAAAMWQNFRARLPFLFDPWSEKKPVPPTLFHGMVAITGMLEGMAVILVPLVLITAAMGVKNNIGVTSVLQSVAYAIAAVLAWWITSKFFRGVGVRARQIWHWDGGALAATSNRTKTLFLGLAGGLLLGVLALGYESVMMLIPAINQQFATQDGYFTLYPMAKVAVSAMAIFMAPFAEEYLFRGLLFRSLDREWGGWRAIVGSAVFFGVYHPPLSWVPVVMLGLFNAWLFKRYRNLWPCVIAHMAYNTVVTLAS